MAHEGLAPALSPFEVNGQILIDFNDSRVTIQICKLENYLLQAVPACQYRNSQAESGEVLVLFSV